jgi:hypothetical protein
MGLTELLTVQERFQHNGIGLTLVPDFPLPPGRWKDFSGEIVVIHPDGREFTAEGHFNMWHFEFRDPKVSLDKRWRIVLTLSEVLKDDVPLGSKIMVSKEIADAVLHGNAT